MRIRPPFVAEAPEEDRHEAGRHPQSRPVSCDADARITARHVERILRACFKFPAVLDHRVTEAAEEIAAEVLAASHQINNLYWDKPAGEG